MSSLIVTLKDYPNIEHEVQEKAERKFMQSLEKSYPDAVELLAVFKIYQDAIEGDGLSLTKDEAKQAEQFHKHFDKARQAGFQQLGTAEEAYFDLRLA